MTIYYLVTFRHQHNIVLCVKIFFINKLARVILLFVSLLLVSFNFLEFLINLIIFICIL